MIMMRTDPFRELERMSREIFGANGTSARPVMMPLDAWRDGDTFRVELDLPGIDPDNIDLDVENNVVTVTAQRPAPDRGDSSVTAERPRGTFSRQLVLGDNLDTDKISANYDAGVLALEIPVAETAKPRKIAINAGQSEPAAISS